MNPLDFIRTIDPTVAADVISLSDNIEFSSINKKICNFLLPNDFNIIYKHISDKYKDRFKESNVGILNYFRDEIENSEIEWFMKEHLREHFLFYVLLVLFVGDKNLRDTSITYMIQQSETRKTSEGDLRQLNVFIGSVQEFITSLHEVVVSLLTSQDPKMQSVIMNFYLTTAYMLSEIYRDLYDVFTENIDLSLKSIGLIPIYWPESYKMRLRLLCELKDHKLILAHLNYIKPYFPLFQCIQRKDGIPTLNPTELLYYMEHLPDIQFTFIKPGDELDKFLNKLYVKDTAFLRPKDAKTALKQYFVVHLLRWDIIWKKCIWPVNRQLAQNIIDYRSSNPTPDALFWKRILFL